MVHLQRVPNVSLKNSKNSIKLLKGWVIIELCVLVSRLKVVV